MDEIKVLWIEEQTGSTLIERKQHLLSDRIIKLDVIATYKRGKEVINSSKLYDAIIIDILIPFDDTNDEIKPYGIDLIKELRNLGYIKKVGIYTNERWDELSPKVGEFPEERFMQKNYCRSNKMFKTFIFKIARNGREFHL